MNQVIQTIILESEAHKKNGDLLFSQEDFQGAITSYDASISQLAALRGASVGELAVARCLLNKSQALVKLNRLSEAHDIVSLALTVPSVLSDPSIWCKLLVNKSQIQFSLGKYLDALVSEESH